VGNSEGLLAVNFLNPATVCRVYEGGKKRKEKKRKEKTPRCLSSFYFFFFRKVLHLLNYISHTLLSCFVPSKANS
jgi:hypothetical protein